jgi:prepilin signal peptidase PulO-like enzyme (type II secretory pathway)
MNAARLTVLFFFGALWGSFFYTLSLRFIDGSVGSNPWKALLSASRCPQCGARVPAAGLVPVLGYLLLKGRCAACGVRISPAYPVMEILYGVLLSALAWKHGISLQAASFFLIAGCAVAVSVVDIKTLTIPDSLIVAMALLSVYPVYLEGEFTDHLIAALALPSLFLIIMFIFPGSFGGGDVKFSAAIGLLMGVDFSVVVMECALVTGSIAGIAYAAATRKNLRTRIPFAPFLTAGLIVALLYGREIILLYRTLVYRR